MDPPQDDRAWRGNREKRSHGFTVIELVVAIAIIGLIVALTLSAVQRAREAAARTKCQNNLRQIGLALHQYHDAQQMLPPGISVEGGKSAQPFLGWNARVLPFLEQDVLWIDIESAFKQDPNFLNVPPHTLRARVVKAFTCPSDPRSESFYKPSQPDSAAFTTYLGVEGTDQFAHDGLLYLDSQIRFTDVKDGLSNTVMVGERPPSANGILGWWYAGWGQDQDGSAEMILGAREFNTGMYGKGCAAGPFHFAPGRPNNQCDTFHFWSFHNSGASFVFADGSVRWVPYSADPIMPALATRAGGEAVSPP